MEVYTIIRGAMFIVSACLYLGNLLGIILYGTLSNDKTHGFVIYTLLSGVPISAFSGAFMYISLANIEEIHGRDDGAVRRHPRWLIVLTIITAILSAGSIYFWSATLIAITVMHREILPLAIVSGLYTILLVVSAFKVVKTYMKKIDHCTGDDNDNDNKY